MSLAALPSSHPDSPGQKPIPVRFYARAPFYFALALLCAVIGFFPSYFAQLRETDLAHHFHGITASLWMIMLIAQSWLMRRGLVVQHRRLGKLSLIVAPAFVISGIMMVHVMLSGVDDFSRTFGPRLAFLDLTTMIYFLVAYVLALHYRRNVQLHARFMASTAVLVLPPAISRLLGNLVPAVQSFEQALHGAYFICEIIVCLLLLSDFRRGRIRAPYIVLMVLLVAQQIGFLLLPSLDAWRAITRWIAAL
jgi:uncharacterized membrane protein YozB (DUF420 family)